MTFQVETERLKKIRVEVKSSLIDFLEYSKQDYLLTVKFKQGKYKGKVRRYEEVAPEDFFSILSAESVGHAVIDLIDSLKSTRSYS